MQVNPDSCRWRETGSPFESFDEDKEWPVNIVGEEVDYWGNIRYEAEWPTWERADGSNTTWKEEYVTEGNLKGWKRRQQRKRRKLAAESLELEIHGHIDIHNNDTRLRAQAYSEKLQRYDPESFKWPELRKKVIAQREQLEEAQRRERESISDSEAPTSAGRPFRLTNSRIQRPRANSSSRIKSGSQRETMTPSSSSAISRERSTVSMTSSSTLSSLSAPAVSSTSRALSHHATHDPQAPIPMSEKAKGKRKFIESSPMPPQSPPPVTSSARAVQPLPIRGTALKSRQERLQQEWSKEAFKSTKAAPIFFYNDVDDEEVPHVPSRFRYLERGYTYSLGIKKPDKNFMLSCDCRECTAAAFCDCQSPSELINNDGSAFFAYNEAGLFVFNVPRGAEVIECTPFCKCDDKCPNRVAQLPRDIPIEIFKTNNRGWGVRALTTVKRGKVLGMYSGLIIPRDKAQAAREEDNSFCFDLDGQEDEDEAENEVHLERRYSVDSNLQGNWTRFINHSCEPNLQIYLVVYDTVPCTGMPYVAFVANQDIPARTELTFDYNPRHAIANFQDIDVDDNIGIRKGKSKGKGKGKGKAKQSDTGHQSTVTSNRVPCCCDANGCRGYL